MEYARTSRLEIHFEAQGEPQATPVILGHGFPDDVRTWDLVVPELVRSGCRTFAPFMRGCGKTRFVDATVPRNGQVAALGQDIIELADALQIDSFVLVGHDLGSDAAFIAASLYPDRVRGLVLLAPNFCSGNLQQHLTARQAQAYWYAWYFSTQRGRDAFKSDRCGFCRRLWNLWSPNWNFDEATFERTAQSFDNPDFVEVVMHCYQHFAGNVEGEPYYNEVEDRLSSISSIAVPTILLHGAQDGATLTESSLGKDLYFSNGYKRQVLDGVGHFIQREEPQAIVNAVLSLLRS